MFSFALGKRDNQILHYMVYDNYKPNIDKIANLCRGSHVLDDFEKISYLASILIPYDLNLLFSKIDVSKDTRDKINMQNTKTECKKSNHIFDELNKELNEIISSAEAENVNVFEKLARNAWERGEPHWA